VGRRVLVRADLNRVQVWCEGDVVADHERVWAKQQTISDANHVRAAQMLRQQRFALVQAQAAETEVEQRRLTDYDTALGVAGFDEEVAL
jgi:3-phosphoglycerate kinase